MANVYTIESLLVGKYYRSGSIEGVIQSVQKRSNVYYDNADAYLVRVRPYNSEILEEYRTVAVEKESE
jgi:hypothetical protein